MSTQQTAVADEAQLYFSVPQGSYSSKYNLSQKAVLFHGVNKSGSWAIASALRDAYEHHGRQSEFMCRYFGIPNTRQLAVEAFAENSKKHCILIDHNLVGLHSTFPQATFATLLREPVRRMISCYYWLQNHKPEAIRGRGIREWVEESGYAYTLCFQFACHEGVDQDVKLKVGKMPIGMMSKIGEEWFDANVAMFGVSELFEETLMMMAFQLGLPSVPIWCADKRNTIRPKWANIDDRLISDISRIISYDVEFYNRKRRGFVIRYNELIESEEVKIYKEACANEREDQEMYGC